MNTRRQVIAVIILLMIILFPFGYSVYCHAFSKTSPQIPKRPDKKYDQCVKDTVYMRYHHMDLLNDLRDQAVREGKYADIGIRTCKECHTSREQFCNKCHDAVNLSPDCFGCHYYPEPTLIEQEKEK